MSCKKIQDRLSEYLDGDLTVAERTRIAEHLGACIPCRRLYRDLEELKNRARAIDPLATPGRDLWPAVAAAIGAAEEQRSEPAPARRASFFGRWIAAAAAALAIGLLVPVVVDRLGSGEPRSTLQRRLDQLSYETLVAQAAIARVEDGMLQPRRDLAEMVAAHRDVLDAETFATIEAEAARLDRAIGEIHVALEEQPDSRQLKLLLAARYRQESSFLQRISRV